MFHGKPTLPLICKRMSAEKVTRTRFNNIENTTDGVELSAGLQPVATASYRVLPEMMIKRKCSENSVPSLERSVVLKQFHSHHTDSAPSHVLGATINQSISGLRLAERSLDLNETHIHSLETTASQPASFAEKCMNLKLLDVSMSDVRSAERSLELKVLHSCHADTSANLKLLNPSMSDVRSSERSIELKILDSYHSDPSAFCFAEKSTKSKLLDPSISDVRSAERSIDLNVYHSDVSAYQLQSLGSAANSTNSEVLDSRNLVQFTSCFDLSISDVRSAERSIEINQLHFLHFDQSASQLHSAGLAEASTDSDVLDSTYLEQIGSFDLSISDVRSAERSLEARAITVNLVNLFSYKSLASSDQHVG